jgi:hypothetical protein
VALDLSCVQELQLAVRTLVDVRSVCHDTTAHRRSPVKQGSLVINEALTNLPWAIDKTVFGPFLPRPRLRDNGCEIDERGPAAREEGDAPATG